MCDHVCVRVICGRIGLCGTVLLRHDVEVRDRQSLFPFSLSFSSLSLFSLSSLCVPLKGCMCAFVCVRACETCAVKVNVAIGRNCRLLVAVAYAVVIHSTHIVKLTGLHVVNYMNVLFRTD